MMRCPKCGRRISEALPICPAHGLALARGTISGAPSPPLEPHATLAERGYRVTRLLGRGGFGAVYAAERTRDAQSVAIKLALRGQMGAIQRLQDEEAALRAVRPPHVPEVLGSGSIPEGFYVVMERIDAPTLADRMVELAGPASLEAFEPLARSILTPLEAVHARGLVHCDLKPENIFVYETGVARLIDFGLARPFATRPESVEVTDTVDDAGTAEYMSPEQCDGLPCDPSCDVYSLGVVFYELLTGAPPFWGPAADVREAHRSRRPQPLSRRVPCTPELDALIRRCLAKEPARRYPDISALRAALEQALLSRAPSKRPSMLRLSKPPGPLKLTAVAPLPKDRRAMGLVFFETQRSLGSVQQIVTAAGGQIVHSKGAEYAAAFGHDVGDNPARVALHAAQRLYESGVAQRLLVDVATVSVQMRPDGSRRIFAALLSKSESYPTERDPSGVMFTRTATEVLADLELRPMSGRPDRWMFATEERAISAQLPPLVGRDALVHSLLATAHDTWNEGRPTIVTVLGPAGFGRTHLAAVVAQELRQSSRNFEVIRLSAQARGVSQVLPKLLVRVLDLPKTPPEECRAFLIARLGETGETTWPGVAHALGWIEADDPEVRRLAAAPGALRIAAARAAGEALRRMAAERPVAVLLDDAHLADEATLDALEYATLKDVPAPVWVCVLAPPTFATSRPTWGSRAALAQRNVLRELAPKDAVELARQLLLPAQYTPDAVLQKLAERTQGVPRLLVELVRGLKRDGYVRKSERGTGFYLAAEELDALPNLPIVQWNAIREIEALPVQLAGHARLAAVLGSGFSVAEVEALVQVLERSDAPEDMQLDAAVGLQRLQDRGILVGQPSGLFDFRHAMLRDMFYQLVPEAQRKRVHRAAFEVYRTLTLPENLRLPRLALHAARSGERQVAADAYYELARRFVHAQAYLEAEAAYSGVLDNLADTDARAIDAARGRGLMRWRLGRHEGALADLRKARELAHAAGATAPEMEIMLDEATVLDWSREASGAIGIVRAVEAMDAPLSPLLRARLAMSRMRSRFREGQIEEAIRAGEEAVQLAAALGDEGYETRIVAELVLAPSYAIAGKLEAAERSFERLIAEAESRGDLHHVSAALGNRALLWHGLCDAERLFADLERSAQLGRELGEAPLEYVGVYNLAESEFVLGRLPSAREHAQRMLELAVQQFGDVNREVSVSELLLARIALYADDIATAREHARNIRSRVEHGRAWGDVEAELEPSAAVVLEMVELATSGGPTTAWHTLLERCRSVELQTLERVELLERAALCAKALGDHDFGRQLYRQVIGILDESPSLVRERVLGKLEGLFV